MHRFWPFSRRSQSPSQPQQSPSGPVELPVPEPIELPGSEGDYLFSEHDSYIAASSTSNEHNSFTRTNPKNRNIIGTIANLMKKVKCKVFLITITLLVLMVLGCVGGIFLANVAKVKKDAEAREVALGSDDMGLSEKKLTQTHTDIPTSSSSVTQKSLTTATVTSGTKITTLILLTEPTISPGSADTAYEIPIGERSLDLKLEATNGACEDQQEWGLGPCSPFALKVRIEEESRKSDYILKTAQIPFNETALNRPYGTTPWYGADRGSWKHRFDGVASVCITSRAWGIWFGPDREVWVHLTETLDQLCEIDEGSRMGTRTIAPMFCQCSWVGELT